MSKVDITVLLRAADGYDFDSNFRADAADFIDQLRERIVMLEEQIAGMRFGIMSTALEDKQVPEWVDGHPCPTCGAAPKDWEYHYPRGDSDKDAEINRLREVLRVIANNKNYTSDMLARAALKENK